MSYEPIPPALYREIYGIDMADCPRDMAERLARYDRFEDFETSVNWWRDLAAIATIEAEQTVCATTEHSDGEIGHVFEYSRDLSEWCCKYCGASPDNDFMEDDDFIRLVRSRIDD